MKRQGLVVVASGEDPAELVIARARAMLPGHDLSRLMVETPGNYRELRQLLENVENCSISLLTVDPLVKFVPGAEDDSGPVNALFSLLEEFGKKTGAAVTTTHHVVKNAVVASFSDAVRYCRGSSVILDRPRVTLAMFRRPDKLTALGIALQRDRAMHNYPAALMFEGLRLLQFDEKTQRHMPVDSGPVPVPDKMKSAVVAAMRRLADEGRHITKTGPKALHALKAPELEGIPRRAIGQVLDALLKSGEAVKDGKYVRLAEALPAEPVTGSQDVH